MEEDSMRNGEAVDGLSDLTTISRRKFIVQALLGAGALSSLPALLEKTGLAEAALAAGQDLTRDTLNGVAVFFVPGPDPYSVHQGESTPEPGGLETGAGEGLFQGLNFANPFVPNLADVVAALMNSTALAVNPAASGPFASPFSNLSFADKARVFAALDGNPAPAAPSSPRNSPAAGSTCSWSKRGRITGTASATSRTSRSTRTARSTASSGSARRIARASRGPGTCPSTAPSPRLPA